MFAIISKLTKSKIVKDFKILNQIIEDDIQLIYLKITLVDESCLFIREIITPEGEKYSYHWQTPKGELIERWDNAPHYKHTVTFPHHKHVKDTHNIQQSERVILEEVLDYIENAIPKNI